MSKPPFVLVPDNLSNETVQCLEELLTHAKRGEVIGIAFTAMLKRRGYIANSAGEAFRNPTFSIGMLFGLIGKMSGRLSGGSP